MLKRFEIHVSDADIDDLRRRLQATRLPGDLANDDWRYGTSRAYLQGFLTAWRDDYDWRAHERAMNAYAHYRVAASGQNLHFLHVPCPGGLPLLLVGGWPQTFWDFADVLPLLEGFELVVPDLPGHGFSTPLHSPGTGFIQTADMFHHLMTEVLGHRRYGIYGMDWGALIGEQLAHKHPDVVCGLHTSMPVPLGWSPAERRRDPAQWTPEEQSRRDAAHEQVTRGNGYLHMQTTRPQTVAYLIDSPAATAAWLIDRVHAWTDHGGQLNDAYPLERLLTTVSLYWFTGTLATAARFYAESASQGWQPVSTRQPVIPVPTAVAAYPKEGGAYPRKWVEQYFNLDRYTVMERGGHFPPVENPKSLGTDIARFFHDLDNRTAARNG
ncbi:epoxide hydrolase family protein [Streptomyces sp. NPDC054962]